MTEKATAVEFEDIEVTMVKLPSGKYLVDGEVIEISWRNDDKHVAVKDVNNIRKVTESSYIGHYVYTDGSTLDISEYEAEKEKLLKNAKIFEDGSIFFEPEFLKDEYEYKKFMRDWHEVRIERQDFSEPIIVEHVRVQVDTGNPFINNMFLNGREHKDYNLYEYQQFKARYKIFTDYMTELGFEKTTGRYDVKTQWHQPSHGGLEFVEAFGGYLFRGNSWSNRHGYTPRGTLDAMQKAYEEDVALVKRIVKNKYVEKFGVVDASKFDFSGHLNALKSVRSSVIGLDFKVKDRAKYNAIVRNFNTIIDKVEKVIQDAPIDKEI